jgi:cytoskeletal protein RodZ
MFVGKNLSSPWTNHALFSLCGWDYEVENIGTAFALVKTRKKVIKFGGMKMKKSMTVMAAMALAMALSVVGFAQQDQSAQPTAQQPSTDTQNAQQPTADQQDSTQPNSPSQDSSSSMQTSQTTAFTGTVVKAGGKYVLKTSDMNYQLDDQQKAKQFVGQQVKVSGSLDTNTSTIHVSDISPAS